MIEIREASEPDAREITELARAMQAESPHYRDYPFDAAKLNEWIRLCLEHDNWLCLIAWEGGEPVGFMAVGAVEMLFCRELVIEDLALFVLPHKRGSSAALRMVRMAESWAKPRAKQMRIGITTGTNQDTVKSFLTRLGYEQCGVLMHKSL